jgi:ATP-binding cassette subfamily G (WHITE) protein 2 (PDR)
MYGLAVEFVPQVAKGKGDILIFLRRRRCDAENNKKHEKQAQEDDTTNSETLVSPNEAGPQKLDGFGRLKRSHDCFTWDKIEYQIPVKGETKTLLTGIHGFIKPGSMTGT